MKKVEDKRGKHRKGKKQTVKTRKEISDSMTEIHRKRKEEEKFNSHRLYFPPKKRRESDGEYRYRKFVYFCETYARHIAGRFSGQPVKLMKWQSDILRKLFSALDKDGKRRYKRIFIHVARKNGKTFMTVLLLLYFLAEESFNDPASEIVSCAATRDQSIQTIFRTARLMVQSSTELYQILKIGLAPAHITNRMTNGTYTPLAADAGPVLGRSVSIGIFDETHLQPNSEMWDAISTSQAIREEPLLISISTAGDSRASFYYTLYERVKAIIADPKLDPTTLGIVYECPEELSWEDPDNFRLANPAMGKKGEEGFRPESELKLALKEAIEGTGETGYRQYFLNQFALWGQKTLVPLDKWDACGIDEPDPEIFKGRRVVAGLDLSDTTDLTALALLIEGPPEALNNWTVFVFLWLAGDNLRECSRRDRLPYEKWVSDEVIYFEGKPTIDVSAVLQVLVNLKGGPFPKLWEIGYDPYNSAKLSPPEIPIPFDDYFKMIPVPQTYAFLSPATKTLKAKILKGEIIHDRNPALRSMFESARVVQDATGNIRLDKSKSNSRIDGIMALTIAVSIASKSWR